MQTYRSVKHSFNSCLPQDVILKYTQYCTSMAVDRRFCTVSKGQRDDNTNPESQRLTLLMSMLPIIQPHQMLSLSKVLFMQDRTTRRGTAVVSSYDSWFAGPAAAESLDGTASLKPEPSICHSGFDPLDYRHGDHSSGEHRID
jgi:hypothetical protein